YLVWTSFKRQPRKKKADRLRTRFFEIENEITSRFFRPWQLWASFRLCPFFRLFRPWGGWLFRSSRYSHRWCVGRGGRGIHGLRRVLRARLGHLLCLLYRQELGQRLQAPKWDWCFRL